MGEHEARLILPARATYLTELVAELVEVCVIRLHQTGDVVAVRAGIVSACERPGDAHVELVVER